MKSGWAVIISLGCGLVLLAFAVRIAVRDVDETTDAAEADRRTAENRSGSADTGRREMLPGRSTTLRGGERATGGGSSDPSRQRPAPLADVRRSIMERGAVRREADGGSDEHDELEPADPAAAAPAARAEKKPGDATDSAENPPPTLPPDVAYDGAGQTFDTQSRVAVAQVGTVTAAAGTMSFWMKPEWESDNPDHANFVQLGESGMRLVKDGKNLRFEYTNTSGDNALGGIADMSGWPTGDWRYLTATWQDGSLALYVDGEQIFVNAPDLPPPPEQYPKLYVGSTPRAAGPPVPMAQLSDIVVMNRSLSNDEILALFAAGAGQHGSP
jgi:hypothetical protein